MGRNGKGKNNITKDIARTWYRKKENMNEHIPDFGHTKDDQPMIYVARASGYRGSLRNKNNKMQLAVFSNKNPEEIINFIELSEIEKGVYAYGQNTLVGKVMLADIYNENSKNIGNLYRNDDLYLRDIKPDLHRDCIIYSLFDYMFESDYTKIIDKPTKLKEHNPETKRTKIIL